MLPRKLPISEEAFRAALDAAWPGLPTGVSQDEAKRRTRASVTAAFKAECFEVEGRSAITRAEEERGPHYRLVSPWKPAPSSTEGGA